MRKNFLAGFILLMSLSVGIDAQDLNQDCNPLIDPPDCQRFVDAIESLNVRITRLQQRVRDASPALKPGLLRNIEQLHSLRSSVTADLLRCRRDHGETPRALARNVLAARLTGTATVRTTHSSIEVPDLNLDLALRFTRNRCRVWIASFQRFDLRTGALVGERPNVEVIAIRGGTGTFHPVSGTMTMSISLGLRYSAVLLADRRYYPSHDEALTFNLTTGNSVSSDGRINVTGSPLTQGGSITLAGATRFPPGSLEGNSGSLIITANISPRP